MLHLRTLRTLALGATAVSMLAFSACSPGSLGSSDPTGGSGDGPITLSLLINNTDQDVNTATAIVEAFNKSQSDVKVELETAVGGVEGDNLRKTKLATGEMNDMR